MRIRFVAINVPLPRKPHNWRIYDTITGSYPYFRLDIGKVRQDTTQAEAQAEAERLNQLQSKG